MGVEILDVPTRDCTRMVRNISINRMNHVCSGALPRGQGSRLNEGP